MFQTRLAYEATSPPDSDRRELRIRLQAGKNNLALTLT